MIVLEDDTLRAGFDAVTGALVELTSVRTGWRILRDRGLGLSFEMVVPLPERLNHRVQGAAQQAARVELGADGKRLLLSWERPVSDAGVKLDLTFEGAVTLNAFGLQFDGRVRNRSPYTVDNVAWPVVGQVAPPEGLPTLERFSAGWSEAQRLPVWPTFRNEQGYWGTDYPMQKAHGPHVSFMLIRNEREGLYVGQHDTDDLELLQFLLELKPGVQNTLTDAVPPDGVVAAGASGGPSRVQLTLQHFSFVPPGEERKLSSVVLRPYVGPWHAGVDCYKAWRESWHRPAPRPSWANEVHAWQQVQLNSIAGEQRCRYDQIVSHAEQCARHGVGVLQLTGWTRNGQDGWLPSHDVDARLGTVDELKSALARCRALGVRIVLYAKFVYVDVGTPEYRDELWRYVTLDRAGQATGHAGWAYFLPSHFAEFNTRRLNWACMNHPGWRRVCLAEYARMLALDPDGVLLDEACHPRGDGRFCFAPDHGHDVPALNVRGDRLLLAEMNRLAAAAGREQLICAEFAHDKHTVDYGASYFRIFAGHVPVLRYIDPHYPMVVGVWGYDDREKINMCLLYRYLIEYEPLNFKGFLDDMPLTVAYGNRVDALRRRYRGKLWDATFRDTSGATVTVAGKAHEAYAVYRSAGGEHSVVVVNHGPATAIEARVAIDGHHGPLFAATPEAPDAVPVDGLVCVPPRSAAVVMQER